MHTASPGRSFHDGIYFVVVTICTVGYGAQGGRRPVQLCSGSLLGPSLPLFPPNSASLDPPSTGDVIPSNNISRLVVLATLGVTFVLLPIRFAKLNEVRPPACPRLEESALSSGNHS